MREATDRPKQASLNKAADEAIDAALAGISRCRARLDRKVLHGPYGKQELLQAIYSAALQLRSHRLARRIRARLARKAEMDPLDLEVFEALIKVALPGCRGAAASNWVCALHYVDLHRVSSEKVRGFLYVRGGINRCAELYRRERVMEGFDEDLDDARPPRERRDNRSQMPAGLRPLFAGLG